MANLNMSRILFLACISHHHHEHHEAVHSSHGAHSRAHDHLIELAHPLSVAFINRLLPSRPCLILHT